MHHPREQGRSRWPAYERQVSWSQPVLHDNHNSTTDVDDSTTDVDDSTTYVDDSTTYVNDCTTDLNDDDHGEVRELGLR